MPSSKTAQAVVQAMRAKKYLKDTQAALLDYQQDPTPEKAAAVINEHVVPTMIMLGNKKPGKDTLASVDYDKR